uniref:Uncharacterized protein n=1 Tax=Kalanchoe fedtschenkoi TaxID=63787 RepID=A0A7N0TZH1_KALFE
MGPTRALLLKFNVLLLVVVIQFGVLVVSAQREPLTSEVERSALLGLRASLGIRARDWPKQADPCRAWAGIGCRNGTVVGVSLYGLSRTKRGMLEPRFQVDSMVNLTRLEVFNSTGFVLHGVIPEWFGEWLGGLQVLDLRSSLVVGSIPESLGRLKELNVLVLADNLIDGRIPEALWRLSRLTVLDLSRNKLAGSVPLMFRFMFNLTRIDLSSNRLSGPVPYDLPRLTYLNLSSNGFMGAIPAELGNMSELVELDLGSNMLSGWLPKSVAALKSLRKMNIGENVLEGRLSDDMFSDLKELEFLDLSYNRFDGAFPSGLWSLPKLTFLDVSGNDFTGTLTELSCSNDSARNAVFDLSNNLFYGGLVCRLGQFSVVDLSGNYFAGKVPSGAMNHTIFFRNCLQSVGSQRSFEDCRLFYAQRGLSFHNFEASSPVQPPFPEPSPKSNKLLAYVIAGVFGGCGFTVILVIVLFCIIKAWDMGHENQRGTADVETVPDEGVASLTKLTPSSFGESFTFDQLAQSSWNFSESNLIKHGHSGDLFRGVLDGGIHVVIKRVDLNTIKKESFMSELELLSKVSHTRLIPFLGHCLEHEDQKFLVYKHMPNGDLSNSLHRKTTSADGSLLSLDWIIRSKIAIEAAEGLCFFHHECTCTPPLVHRDIQSTSILLDDKFEVRLGSLSEVHVQEGDPHSHLFTRLWRSSDQFRSGSPAATCAYDVYCFGKVLLELVTGQAGMSNADEATTKQWLEKTLPHISIYDKEPATKIMDASLVLDDDLLDEVWSMAIVARTCLDPKPSRRPPMRHILKALENPLKVVRDERSTSAKLKPSSSMQSWTAAFFGSWLQGSLAPNREENGSFKHSDRLINQGSIGHNNHSSSRKRQAIEICPEPDELQDLETQD